MIEDARKAMMEYDDSSNLDQISIDTENLKKFDRSSAFDKTKSNTNKFMNTLESDGSPELYLINKNSHDERDIETIIQN